MGLKGAPFLGGGIPGAAPGSGARRRRLSVLSQLHGKGPATCWGEKTGRRAPCQAPTCHPVPAVTVLTAVLSSRRSPRIE